MFGVSDDTARGWGEMGTIPTAKIGRRRFVNLDRIVSDLSRGKTIFCSGDYGVNANARYNPRHEPGCRSAVWTAAELFATMRSRSQARQKGVHEILNNPF